MKKLLSLLLLICIAVQALPTNVSAQNSSQNHIEYLDDGSYIVTTITEQPNTNPRISPYSTTKTVTKTKSKLYYSNSNKLAWSIQVTGTFTYGNGTSKCISSVITTNVYDSSWKISNKQTWKNRNTAYASATAKLYKNSTVIEIMDKLISLTCSPTGVFS